MPDIFELFGVLATCWKKSSLTLSIRKFLVINLLLTFVLTVFLMLAGNYYLVKRDIRVHSEATMIALASSYEATLGKCLHSHSLGKSHLPSPSKQSLVNQSSDGVLDRDLKKEKLAHHFFFQIWKNNQLLLSSDESPKASLLLKKDGFGVKVINGERWRIYTVTGQHYPIRIAVAEHDVHDDLTQQIVLDDILIVSIVFPCSMLLMFLVIVGALNSLKKITLEISSRRPLYLEPVKFLDVPKEIQPLIDEINALLLRLKQGFEREKRFSADAAHELRTPLAALKMQTQVALEAKDPATKELALTHVVEGVNRTTHLVQQLLTLDELMAQTEIPSEDVLLHKITLDVIAEMAPQAISKKIDIELLPENQKTKISGDPKILKILIWNLVDNAIRYTPSGGEIIASIKQVNEKVILKISDNGLGIPDELRKRIFERFFRVLGNDTPGSGLGFAIIEQVVRLHKATIDVSSPTSGQGFEVSVIFSAI